MDTKTEIIKREIEIQFGSINKFSEHSGIPKTTIASALRKGIGGTAIDTVFKICELLAIDVNRLKQNADSNDGQKVDTEKSDIAISDDSEREILATYRELNTDNQAYIRVRADELLKGQLSTEETVESDTEDIKTFKIASRNGKNETHLTKEQRKILAEAIDNSINNHEEEDLSDLV